MRYVVEGTHPITRTTELLYASDFQQNAEVVAAGNYVQTFFENVRVVDTEDEEE